MRKIKQTERPFLIRYTNGDRHLFDSAATLAKAKERAAAYLAKRRDGRAEVFKRGALVLKLTLEFSEGMPAGADTGRAVEVGPQVFTLDQEPEPIERVPVIKSVIFD